jgi:para-aminobenzoate synthetase component 1
MAPPPISSPILRDLPGWRDPIELLARARRRRRPALLCSGAGHPSTGRFSILAADPWLTLTWKAGAGEIRGPDGLEPVAGGDPFDLIEEIRGRAHCAAAPPWPFSGGAIGWISYDTGRAVERLPERAIDDRPFPWVDLSFYSWAINWDHQTGKWAALASGAPGGPPAERLCAEAASWALGRGGGSLEPPARPPAPWCPPELSLGRDEYMAGVERIRGLIGEGECYQVNLTRRITAAAPPDPLRLFRELVRTNPAPFAAWVSGSDGLLVGSSPERFLRLAGGRVESRPIKGTARRSPDPCADREAAARLGASGKNRAENVMIVDLVRNDLGRVCRPGSVRVEGLCEVESFEGLHHLVSTISGELDPGVGPMDTVRALFPPGSMTGAPKIRAMEIIEEIEPVRRGPYAGAAGYISASGDLDLSVIIRSFLISEGRADLQVGGAVVADSEPEAEFEESVLKAERALEALKLAVGVGSVRGSR